MHIEEIAQHNLAVTSARLNAKYAGSGMPVIWDGAQLTIQGAEWTIRIVPDELSLEECTATDRPPAFNATASYRDPALGASVTRAYTGTALEHHEQMVAQWVAEMNTIVDGDDTNEAVLWDADEVPENIEYQDPDPTTDGVPWEDDVVGELGTGPGVAS